MAGGFFVGAIMGFFVCLGMLVFLNATGDRAAELTNCQTSLGSCQMSLWVVGTRANITNMDAVMYHNSEGRSLYGMAANPYFGVVTTQQNGSCRPLGDVLETCRHEYAHNCQGFED